MKRPNILSKKTIIKHELLMCKDDDNVCYCIQCFHNKILLELIDYTEELERENLVNHSLNSSTILENKKIKQEIKELREENLILKTPKLYKSSIENDIELSNENKYLLELASLK